jgi:hypothetical protein
MSGFTLKYFGVKIDSIFQKNGATQKMMVHNEDDPLVIPLECAGYMFYFKHCFTTAGEVKVLKQYCLIQGDTPWNPSSFSDQVTDKFYQQVIDNELVE